jgi:hypothetical protein
VHLQQAVGGDVDVVQLHSLLSMWVHGEGLFSLPFIPLASLVAAGMGFKAQPYCGTAVFTGGVDEDGADLTLSRKLAGTLVEMGEELRAAPEMLGRLRARSRAVPCPLPLTFHLSFYNESITSTLLRLSIIGSQSRKILGSYQPPRV